MLNSRIISSLAFTLLLATAINPTMAREIKPAEKPLAGALDIAAVVNDKAISSFDLNNRIKFILVTTRISDTPDTIAKIKPQILRTLIDESLQLQEAQKNSIKVDDKEVAQAIAGIEAQRGLPAGGIAALLNANNIPQKIFNDQIQAQLAWNKLLSKTVRPRIKISDEEVNLAQGHMVISEPQNISIKEMEISIINLPIDKPQREGEIRKLGDKLYSELRKGAPFEEIARQFSSGGDTKPFWIRPEQLDPTIAQVLRTTKEGSITPPMRSNTGVSIIKLVRVRANKPAEPKKDNHDYNITMKEILLKLKPTATEQEADVLLKIGEEVSKNPGKCEDKGVGGISEPDNYDIEVNMRSAALSELPPALRSISETLKLGDISMPFASAEGIRLYMLCNRKAIAGSNLNNDKIKETIYRQKFELEVEKYIRNLRREAFIDVRI
jgi:peptidyl-prolyl cis-trans isomerase SurA